MGAPATLQMGQTGTVTLLEFEELAGAGAQLPDVGPVDYTSDNLAVATVDELTGVVTPVSPGTCNLTGLDTGDQITDSIVLTVTAATAKSGVLEFKVN